LPAKPSGGRGMRRVVGAIVRLWARGGRVLRGRTGNASELSESLARPLSGWRGCASPRA
jgi:hypothetical protein